MDKKKEFLSKYVPEKAVDYCFLLWNNDPFQLVVKKARSSKLGDYRYNSRTRRHTISLNGDLNPYSFLITYIHEVAHLHTFKEYKNRVKPHGSQWKQKFKQLMLPVLNDQVFPNDILRVLSKHLKNPKASSSADPQLTYALSKYNEKQQNYLFQLPEGQIFTLGNRSFKKGPLRRTRYLCEETKTRKKYLVSKMTPIKLPASHP